MTPVVRLMHITGFKAVSAVALAATGSDTVEVGADDERDLFECGQGTDLFSATAEDEMLRINLFGFVRLPPTCEIPF